LKAFRSALISSRIELFSRKAAFFSSSAESLSAAARRAFREEAKLKEDKNIPSTIRLAMTQ
jgi:hypothetical protein